MRVDSKTILRIDARVGSRCEYCKMHCSLQGATFHVEHVVPCSRGGDSDPKNLAWACPGCNLKKSDRTEAIDTEADELVSLFHPRKENWAEHFRWDLYE